MISITIRQAQIEQYIREGLARRVSLADGEEFAIDLQATRTEGGYTCVATVQHDSVISDNVETPLEGEPETIETTEGVVTPSEAPSVEDQAPEQEEADTSTEEPAEEPPEEATTTGASTEGEDDEPEAEETSVREESSEEPAPAPARRPSIFSSMQKPSNN